MVTANKQDNKIDPATVEKIKSELLEKKRQILIELKNFTDNPNGSVQRVKFPQYGTKSDENAQEIDEYSTNLATEKVLESSLRDIENALDRIEKGTYGICKYCGQPIGEKRMLARPVSNTCVACKTKLQNSN